MRQNVSGSWNRKNQYRKLKDLEMKQHKMHESVDEQLFSLNSKMEKISVMLENMQHIISDIVCSGIDKNLLLQTENKEDIVEAIGEMKEFSKGMKAQSTAEIEKISVMLENMQHIISDIVCSGIDKNLLLQTENKEDIVEAIGEMKEFSKGMKAQSTAEIEKISVMLENMQHIISDIVCSGIDKNLLLQTENKEDIVEAIGEMKEFSKSLNARNSTVWEANFGQLQELMKIIIANDLLDQLA